MKPLPTALGTLVLFLGLSAPAHAVPFLQLGMIGGVYDPVTETIVAPGGSFQLFALLTPKAGTGAQQITNLLGTTYYVSAALVPKTGPLGATLGSVSFGPTGNVQPYTVTGDMVYGTPPVEFVQSTDPHDLPQHGIFETYFLEVPFTFTAANRAVTTNTQELPGTLIPDSAGRTFYATFSGSTAGLTSGYDLHFDLYDEKLRGCTADGTCADIDVDHFAPFSHDAQTNGVPEPPTGLLLLIGLGMSAAFGRLRANS